MAAPRAVDVEELVRALLRALPEGVSSKPAAPKAAPTDPTLPRCRGCGVALGLTPHGWNQPSVDAMNLAAGVPLCQRCLLEDA